MKTRLTAGITVNTSCVHLGDIRENLLACREHLVAGLHAL